MGADIVAFPEIYVHANLGPADRLAEELPGPTTARIMQLAHEHDLYVIWPLWERSGSRLFNSAVLIDRRGEIAGVYHKMYPTIEEIEGGIVPGEEACVFATEIGRVGIAICFDLNFREVMTRLAANGAEIIFFCSMYRGGMQLRYWAWELGVYVASAVLTELGQIIDLTGNVLAESTYEALIARRINLNRRLLHMDYNWEKMDKILEKYGGDITFDYVTREACFAIGSERPGLSIEAVIDEFGLERRADYFARARARRDQAVREGTRDKR